MKPKNCLLFFVGLVLFCSANGQLCQGSLGDPIVNITFGSGSNPGPSLAAASTNYSFKSGDCPDDGYYSIVNRTSSCFSNSWHSLNSDHTGNPNGYFMLVNASFQPSAFYVDTVDVLCNNTTYEFAAWIMNVLTVTRCSSNPIQPNLTFLIEKTDGTILQKFDSGTIPSDPVPTWKQYGFFFTTPVDVSRVVVRIINNAPGGCGNDLALDDITFRPCGPLVNAFLNGSNAAKEMCEGQTTQLNFSSTVSAGFTNPYLQWQQSIDGGAWTDIPSANSTALTKNVLLTTTPGVYQYRMSVSKMENTNKQACRINSNVLTVHIYKNPNPAASYNGPLCEANTLVLSAKDGNEYKWTGPNSFDSSGASVSLLNAQTFQSGKYYVEVTNAAGCKGKDSISVSVNPRPVGSASPDKATICEGAAVSLSGSGGGSYLWKPSYGLSSLSDPNPSASPKDTTKYMLVVSNSFSCTDTAYVQVNVLKKPAANAGVDKFILSGDSTRLSGTAGGTNISYSWSPSLFMNNTSSLNPTVNPTNDITYILQVASNNNCGIATDSVKVHVFKAVYVPNAFSPNNDGLNDYWNIPALKAYAEYEILVFNRYGEVVYKSKNINTPWDGNLKGKALPTGVYPYVIDIKQVPKKLTGWVMIIR